MPPFRSGLGDDPLLAGPSKRREPKPDQCPQGGKCDGSGWVKVQPAYAANLHPMPEPLPLNATSAEIAVHALAVRSTEALRRSAEESYYPCRDCAPDTFGRWVGGHLKADHNRRACPECSGSKR